MKLELRKSINKGKTINLKNGILNGLFIGMVNKSFFNMSIWFLFEGPRLKDLKMKL